MDPNQVQKLLRVCRVANRVVHVNDECQKMMSMLRDSTSQSVRIIEAKGLVTRVHTKTVQVEDVRNGARAIVNALPKIYSVVNRHIRKQVTNAET